MTEQIESHCEHELSNPLGQGEYDDHFVCKRCLKFVSFVDYQKQQLDELKRWGIL